MFGQHGLGTNSPFGVGDGFGRNSPYGAGLGKKSPYGGDPLGRKSPYTVGEHCSIDLNSLTGGNFGENKAKSPALSSSRGTSFSCSGLPCVQPYLCLFNCMVSE